MTSQASASSKPPVMAGPLMAAMIGPLKRPMASSTFEAVPVLPRACEPDLSQFLQIDAGAEGPARAGQDQHADARVLAEFVEGAGQLLPQLPRQGIHGRRTIERHDGIAARIPVDLKCHAAHRAAPGAR